MLSFKYILCPTDFSEPSYEGLRYAIELAARFGAELGVVHVIPLVPQRPSDPNYVFSVPEYEMALHSSAERRLLELIKEWVPKEIKVSPITGHGNAGKEILQIAEEQKADMIVIATHGLTGWRRVVFGSVAEQVVRSATCPVLTVRAPHQ
jgi:universal stress protein A